MIESENVWVKVDCIAQHKIIYMVEVPKDHPEYALDAVTCQEVKEFSQEFLGEIIFSHRVIKTTDKAIKMCREANDYCKNWSDEMVVEAFFTKDGEKVVL